MKLKFKVAFGIAEALGYGGTKTAADVQKFLKSQPDEVTASVDGEDIAVKTVTISVSADAGEEVQVLDETPDMESAEDGEDMDPNDEVKSLKLQLETKEAQLRIAKRRSTPDGQVKRSGSVDEMGRTSVSVAGDHATRTKAAFDRKIKRGDSTGFKCADEAEQFGSYVRLQHFGTKSYPLRSHDERVMGKALGTSPNSDGGALANIGFADSIIELKNEFGAFRQIVGVYPMSDGTEVLKQLDSEGSISVNGENVTITESQPTFKNPTLVAKEIAMITPASNSILQDANPALADTLARSMARKAAEFEDNSGFRGDGTSAFGGFVGFESVITSASASYFDLTASDLDSVTLAEVNAAFAKLPPYVWSRGNVGIACSLGTYWRVFDRLARSAGGATFEAVSGSGPRFQYNGVPVIIDATATDASSDNDTAFYVGAFDLAAKFGERQGVQIDTNDGGDFFKKNQTAYRLIERIDINVHEGSSTTVTGPVVRAVI